MATLFRLLKARKGLEIDVVTGKKGTQQQYAICRNTALTAGYRDCHALDLR